MVSINKYKRVKGFWLAGLLAVLSAVSKAEEPLVIAVDHFPPLLAVNRQTGEISGECFERLKQLIDLPMLSRSMPWRRAFHALAAGQVDIIPCSEKSPERENMGLTFVGPILEFRQLLVTRKGESLAKDQLMKARAVFLNGDDEIERYGFTNYFWSSSASKVLELIVVGRADYTLMPEPIYLAMYKGKALQAEVFDLRDGYLVLGPSALKRLDLEALEQKLKQSQSLE